jgi:basic membrane protein A
VARTNFSIQFVWQDPIGKIELRRKKVKKTIRYLGLLVGGALVLAACQQAATEAPPPDQPPDQPAEPSGPFRIAVVAPSATNDLAFTQSMFDAVSVIQIERGADSIEIAFSEGMFVVDDAAAAIRDYATEGFDLVIAHGSQYGSSLQEIAPDFPDTSFAWGTTVDTFGLDNVYAYEARSEQGGFANGVLAARMSESGILGVVGPIETGDAKLYVDGFVAGATSVDPSIEVNVNWIGSFSDVALASEAAQTHINAGADVLTGTAQMVVGAVGVAEENGVLWFGTQANQSSLAPSIVAANQVYDWTVVLDPMIDNILAGTLGGESFELTLANGGLAIEYNSEVVIPDSVMAVADATINGIVDGSIDPLGTGEASYCQPIRVAVVMPSPINDLAFSQSMYDGLSAIQDECGDDVFEFAFSESMFIVDDAAAAMRDYALEGYNLVIGHGSQYGSSLQEIAPDFPETSFAWGTTVDTFGMDNVYAYEARSEQGGYANGVIAAGMSDSGVIGVVGPIETGDAKLYVDGFVAGAQSVNPDIEVNVNWIGSFSDVALASEAAQTHITAGADVLTGTAQMVVGAIGVAQENGVLWFGTQANQSSLAPDVVVANQVYDWTVVLKQIISNFHAGALGGESFALTFGNGGLTIEYNPEVDVPADVRSLADEAVEGIADGSITVDAGG